MPISSLTESVGMAFERETPDQGHHLALPVKQNYLVNMGRILNINSSALRRPPRLN